jgi:hypothetical protein
MAERKAKRRPRTRRARPLLIVAAAGLGMSVYRCGYAACSNKKSAASAGRGCASSLL